MASIRMEMNVAGMADATPPKVVSSVRPRNNTVSNNPPQLSDASANNRVERVPGSSRIVAQDPEVCEDLKTMLIHLLPAVVTPELRAKLAFEYGRNQLAEVWQSYYDLLHPIWQDLTGFMMAGLTTGHSLRTAKNNLTSPIHFDDLVVGGAVSGLLLARDAGLQFDEAPFRGLSEHDFFWLYAGIASSLLKGRGLSNAETGIALDLQAINYTREELVSLLNDEKTLLGDALYRVTLPRLGVEERYRAWAAAALLEYSPADLKLLLHDEPNLMALLETGLEDREDLLAMLPQPAATAPTPCTSPQPRADGVWTRLGAAWTNVVLAVKELAVEICSCCRDGTAAALASCKGAASAFCTYVSGVFRSTF